MCPTGTRWSRPSHLERCEKSCPQHTVPLAEHRAYVLAADSWFHRFGGTSGLPILRDASEFDQADRLNILHTITMLKEEACAATAGYDNPR